MKHLATWDTFLKICKYTVTLQRFFHYFNPLVRFRSGCFQVRHSPYCHWSIHFLFLLHRSGDLRPISQAATQSGTDPDASTPISPGTRHGGSEIRCGRFLVQHHWSSATVRSRGAKRKRQGGRDVTSNAQSKQKVFTRLCGDHTLWIPSPVQSQKAAQWRGTSHKDCWYS